LLGKPGRLNRLQYDIRKIAADTMTYGKRVEAEADDVVASFDAIGNR
jgi:hypothetical protein